MESEPLTERLVGRDRELAEVGELLAEVAGGRGAVLLVEGEAGIGKSHLLAEVSVRARAAGIRTLRGAGREIERDMPFAPLLEAFGQPTRTRIAATIAEEPTPGPELRLRLVEQLLEEIEEAIVGRPSLIVLDDVHWVDPSTLLVLSRLHRSLSLLSHGLVLAARLHPRGVELEALIDELDAGGGRRILLEPLPSSDVEALARELIGARPGPRLRQTLEAAGGNPLYVREVLAALEGAIVTQRGLADAAHIELPASVHQTIMHRLRYLPADTLSLLRTAAVLGSEFAVADLAVATASGVPATLDMLDAAIRAAVVQPSGSRFRFRHDLVRDAFYESVPLQPRRDLHRDIADALARAGRPASSIAPHLVVSAEPGDEEALALLRQAAADAAPQAPSVAAELLARALDVAAPDHPERYEIELAQAEALLWAGCVPDAERLVRRLLTERPSDSRAGRILLDALFLEGRLAECLPDVEALTTHHAEPEAARAGVLARASGAYFHRGDLGRAEQLAGEALQLGEQGDDMAAVSVALTVLARIDTLRGDLRSCAERLGRAAQLVLDGAFRGGAVESVGIFAQLVLGRSGGRFEEARDVILRGIRLAEHWGQPSTAGLLQATLGPTLYHAGRLDEAATAFETFLRISEEGGTGFLRAPALAWLAYIEALRNDPAASERHLAAAYADPSRQGDPNIAPDFDVAWARAFIHELEGEDAPAAETLEALRERAEATGLLHLLGDYVWYGPAHIRNAVGIGDRRQAQRALETTEAGVALLREAFPVEPWVSAYSQLCRGLAEQDAALLTSACDGLRATSRRLLLAGACEEAGRLLAGDGDRAAGVALLEEAHELWGEAGAVRKERALSRELRDLGVRRARVAPAAGQTGQWPELTATESQVADLVAEGLTYRAIADRLFISKRTVETHVAHIFGKVGLSSRAELAAEAMRRRAI